MKYLLTLAAIMSIWSLAYFTPQTRPPHQYSIDLDESGYRIYDRTGTLIGTVNAGTCPLDQFFITDNE